MKSSRWGSSRVKLLVVTMMAIPLPLARGQAANVQKVEAEFLAQAERGVGQYRKSEAVLSVKDRQGKPVPNASVEIRQREHEFLFGCIGFELVRSERLPNPDLWKQRFRELFNFAVFPFYWAGYEPQPGKILQEETLAAVKWCTENGITTKGHPLVWTNDSGTPKWLAGLSPEESEERLLQRVTREVGAFAGAIDIWDVVNEPIHCRAWKNTQAGDYIQEPITAIADYVDKAFRAAHAANPKAHLILNEFMVIARQADRERFYELVAELKQRGTPISGLGIQAHEPREEWFSPEKIRTTLDRLGELGYPLHITEFIPQSGGKPITGGWREGTWTEEAQAEFAEQFYRLCFGHPAVASINWWGLSDRRIWLPGGGLLRDNYEPKPVYTRLKDLIHRQWRTEIVTKTDEKGQVAFPGFFGAYDIVVTPEGRPPQTEHIALKKGGRTRWDITVE
ncbi:MAG: endo-1,4-beta-xylanase [Planctomycetes bacterium]|nr:endo-1,4-beta-xylanase [Planctomycetota bacterium]